MVVVGVGVGVPVGVAVAVAVAVELNRSGCIEVREMTESQLLKFDFTRERLEEIRTNRKEPKCPQ